MKQISDSAVIHQSAYIDDDVWIGENTKVWHFCHVLPHTQIGANCSFGQNCSIGPNVQIGDQCKVQNNVSLYDGVHLENGVFCGPSCVFTNVVTPRAEFPKKTEFRKTHVKQGASIGANATIVCGVTLGQYCLIAAGAVVTKDVLDFAVMAGVPARQMGWISRYGYRLGSDLVCPETGETYVLEDGVLHLMSP